MTEERRQTPRYQFSTEVAIDAGSGHTVDVSGNGMLIDSAQPFTPGDRVALVIPLEVGSPAARVTCAARVVRVEARGDRYAVAVTYEPVDFQVPAIL